MSCQGLQKQLLRYKKNKTFDHVKLLKCEPNKNMDYGQRERSRSTYFFIVLDQI